MSTPTRSNSRWAVPLILTLGLGLGGCDEPLGLEGKAQVETAIEGSGEAEQTSAPSPAPEPATQTSTSDGSGEVTGSVEVQAKVLVQSAGGEWMDASGGSVRQVVQIDGSDGLKLLARTGIEAGEYIRVRVEFESIAADVESGLVLGVGDLTGRIDVEAGADGKVVVERDIHFVARTNSRTRIRVALNAGEWLGRASLSARAVSEADFRNAVGIHVD